jgi:hypothetical protein
MNALGLLSFGEFDHATRTNAHRRLANDHDARQFDRLHPSSSYGQGQGSEMQLFELELQTQH